MEKRLLLEVIVYCWVSSKCYAFIHIACNRMGICMALSTWSTTSLEDVAEANGDGFRWFQMYFYDDFELIKHTAKRAEAAGYKALLITVDQPVTGLKPREVKSGFDSLPPHLSIGSFKFGSALRPYAKEFISPQKTWEAIDKLRSITSLPIILKGILRPDDAREALKHDIQGIMVSNHGGRQLDTVPATVC